MLDKQRARWWWYLGVPLGIAAGALLAVWVRTSREDALTLQRGEQVDGAFTAALDPVPLAVGTDGRFLLVAFGYTSCPDICPTTLIAVHRALERLGSRAERVVPVFVTVDPERDTRERLERYVRGFDARIRSVSDPVVVAKTLRAFHARAAKRASETGSDYAMDHTAILYVLDPGRRVIAALPEASASLADEIDSALLAAPGLAGSVPAR